MNGWGSEGERAYITYTYKKPTPKRETLGPVTFARRHSLLLPEQPGDAPDGAREYSEATAQALDLEAKKILEERLEQVVQLLRDKRPLLDRLAALLLEKEVLEREEFERMVQADTSPRVA